MSSGTKVASIDKKLANQGGLPLFLQRKIHFKEAMNQESTQAASFSYHPSKDNLLKRKRSNESQVDEHGFRSAPSELFPATRINEMMRWERIVSVGPGLNNVGNTCFLNSVLQCLTYTPPLANFLLTRDHSKRCKVEGFCILCELERHLDATLGGRQLQDRARNITPSGTVGHLKAIAKHMRIGRQEDSHEFLRFMIESMQKSLLFGLDVKRLDNRTKETTLVHQIFGGHLQSCVRCLTCNHVSSTFDPFLDLSLDVKQADSVERALRIFTQAERLCKSNRYKCEHCGKLTDADKNFNIYRNPAILTVHLKRFQMSPYGETSKLNKSIEFNPVFDISHFSKDTESGGIYDLYAVLVHEGYTCNSGHYHAFVKAPNGIWYSMNDSSVHQVGLNTVLGQRAYLLFYTRRPMEKEPKPKETAEPTPVAKPKEVKIEVKPRPETPIEDKAAALPTPQDSPASIKDLKEKMAPLPPILASSAPDAPLAIASSMWHISRLISPNPKSKPSNKLPARSSPSWMISPITKAAKLSMREAGCQ